MYPLILAVVNTHWSATTETVGLIIKDPEGLYEPGKRRWMKMKKDYLEEGRLADSLDLVVLGATCEASLTSIFLRSAKRWAIIVSITTPLL